MSKRKDKIQGYRKLGHLWQAAYGQTIGSVRYGYGITRIIWIAAGNIREEQAQ